MKVPFDRKLKWVEASQVEMKAVVQSEGTARTQVPSQWIDWCEPGRALGRPVWLEVSDQGRRR